VARAAAELESTVDTYQAYLAAEQSLADAQKFLKEEAAGAQAGAGAPAARLHKGAHSLLGVDGRM
jgi:hypothetical protein